LDVYSGYIPHPTPETLPYFQGLKNHKLMLQKCLNCDVTYFYPRPICPACGSRDTHWYVASGKGTLYSYVISHRDTPGYQAPYVIAVVELEEGPRMMSNLIDIAPSPDHITCDMPLEIYFDDVTDTTTLPRFKPFRGDSQHDS